MGLFDSVLKQIAGSPDTVASLAEKVGVDPGLAEKAVAALGASHAEPGDTVELASAKTGLDARTLSHIVEQLGGEGALAAIAGQLNENPELAGVLSFLDRDGDGNPLDDVAGFAKGLFGKK